MACSFGKIVCKQNSNGFVKWYPSDPCESSTNVVYQTTTKSLNFQDKLLFVTSRTNLTRTIQTKNVTTSTESFQNISKQIRTTKILNNTNNYFNFEDNSQDFLYFILWLICIISLSIILISLGGCFLIYCYFQKQTKKIKFLNNSNSKNQNTYPMYSSNSNNDSTQPFLVGLKSKNSSFNDYSNKLSYVNGSAIDKKFKTKSKFKHLSKMHNVKLKKHNQSINSKTPQSDRKLINWQDSAMQQFSIPPSPKSINKLNSIQLYNKFTNYQNPSIFNLTLNQTNDMNSYMVKSASQSSMLWTLKNDYGKDHQIDLDDIQPNLYNTNDIETMISFPHVQSINPCMTPSLFGLDQNNLNNISSFTLAHPHPLGNLNYGTSAFMSNDDIVSFTDSNYELSLKNDSSFSNSVRIPRI